MASVRLEESDGETRAAVVSGLRAHNEARAGSRNTKPVTLSLRDEEGRIVGGLLGEVKWSWLHVDLLWIDEAHRGRGHGEALIRQAEEVARQHGATGAYLGTMSFQAPGFYARLGYREFGRLDGFPVQGCHLSELARAL